ncbi:TPA: IS21 family transposase [Legionella pneumophila]|nr:IS21 family transposase [Legionella pneumophila]HDO7828193.1 IS21 family transposase [Legionella pneumophila]HDO7831272.1 IS21 family transposase [Legionella pneumophila]HDO9828339.1 IS21 family transposase [Legionella pneumophila]
MSGQWLTSKQVEIYMNARKEGKSQAVSAAKSGISERRGRDIEKGKRIEPVGQLRTWRTRTDPFKEVWASEIEPMLRQSPTLSPLTVLEYLQSVHGGESYPDKLLRTLQRRVKCWLHQEGPAREVIFRQEHEPGHMGLSDFTELKGITVTIQGKRLRHLLYHFRVIYSGWSYMKVILGGESYTALAEGLQNALWCLGGAPKVHRTDSLSAAFKNFSSDDKDDQTQRYHDFCTHYGMTPTRNNRGVSHENGGIESPHGHLKRRIKQAFLLRGSYDFDSVEAYQCWIEQVVSQHNRRNAKTVDIEKLALQPLPTYKTADYTVLPAKVSSSSTMRVRGALYTVPSRLKGASLLVHLYHDSLSCYLGGALVAKLHRVYSPAKNQRARNIDYRHVIDSLVKKPMAFFNSQLRDDILPNAQYRQIWQTLASRMTPHDASRLIVGILHLAASADCETALGEVVTKELFAGKIPILSELKTRFGIAEDQTCPTVDVIQHTLESYNSLIPMGWEVYHAVH